VEKLCSQCGIVKNVALFYFSKRAKDGLQNCCKQCSKFNRKAQNAKNKKNIRKKTPEEIKLKKKQSDRAWRVKNPGKARARSRRYDKRVELATPSWLTKDQRKQIDAIYENCPVGCHVDHIMPLNGRNLCGLHVPWNLQYLSADKNIKKSNKVLT
jgi:hypothetical protein